jgi:hypothetical protein
LDIVIWNLFDPILRSGGACNLLFLSEPEVRIYEPEAVLSGLDVATPAINYKKEV